MQTSLTKAHIKSQCLGDHTFVRRHRTSAMVASPLCGRRPTFGIFYQYLQHKERTCFKNLSFLLQIISDSQLFKPVGRARMFIITMIIARRFQKACFYNEKQPHPTPMTDRSGCQNWPTTKNTRSRLRETLVFFEPRFYGDPTRCPT